MGRKKIHERHIRKVQRSKGSYYVTLPIGIMRELSWRQRQRVEVRRYGKHKIVITDWEKK